MSNQLFEDGKIVNVDGNDLECVAVTYTEDSEGVKTGFAYHFRLQSEVEAERQAAAQAEAERLVAEQAAIDPTAATPVSEPIQPEQPKEETQYVK